MADQVLAELAQDTNQGCIGELRETAVRLDREGFVNRPGWIALKDGQRPEAVEMWEPGEWLCSSLKRSSPSGIGDLLQMIFLLFYGHAFS